MKKILSILGTVVLTTTGVSGIVACNKKEQTNILDEVATEKYYNDLANFIILKKYFSANKLGNLVVDKKITKLEGIVEIEINANKINDVINLNNISDTITEDFSLIFPKISLKTLIDKIKENLINFAKKLNIEINNNIINFQNISLEKESNKKNNIVVLYKQNKDKTIEIN